MTSLQIVGALMLLVIVLLILLSIFNRIIEKREMDTAIQDSMVPFTNDPLFDEIAQLAQNTITDYKEYLRDTKQYLKRRDEQNEELLRDNLRLQRLELQLDLLGKINSENVIQKYPHQRLDWWSVAATIHFVRNIIRSITNE
ncbi:MAG TPA: hypothetical protein ENI23_07330 [bacterium]|nr:hypothetical protein [bacterium]